MHLVPFRNYKPTLSLGNESCLHLLLILKANLCVGEALGVVWFGGYFGFVLFLWKLH